MTTVISGNWKMNGSKAMIDQWFVDFTKSAKEFEDANNLDGKELPLVLICVPDVYIEYAINKAKEYNLKMKYFKVLIGAEDCHFEEKGAFTGNTSPLFLNEISCPYTLVGHSERRQYQNETDSVIAKKANAALAHGIIPVVCFGEDLATREAGKHLEVVGEQILKSTEGLDLTKAILAYEPVWAIGTGKVPTEAEIDEMNGYVRELLKRMKNVDANKLVILYGGSVKGSNAKSILNLNNVNGVLVGGASMKGQDFFDIVKGNF